MIRLTVFLCCLAYGAAVGQEPQEGLVPPPVPAEVARRELTDTGYVIRYGDRSFRYPLRVVPVVRQIQTQGRNPTETNEIENEDRRPLFYFTTYEASDNSPQKELPADRPYIEIRRKREATAASPETDPHSEGNSQKVNLRKKRTYCGKCGHGGYKSYYVPVSYAVYPVYYGGGGGKGCKACGGGYGGGLGGGFGGSFSYSHSSAGAGSFGWGK